MNDENYQTPNPKAGASMMQTIAIPVAIIIGFGLIAAAIYFSGLNRSTPVQMTDQAADDAGNKAALDTTTLSPVTADDHIQGNPNAPIVFVEYSDYDCPFCRLFHDTMTKIMDEYGQSGQVAWVYRQFPIESLHPNAPTLSEASECVASLGGNDAFWKFTNALNDSRAITYDDSGNVTNIEATDMNKLPDFVAAAGVDENDYNDCMNNAGGRAAVSEDHASGVAIDVTGTPHTIVLFNGKQGVLSGAKPYETVKQFIDSLLAQSGQ